MLVIAVRYWVNAPAGVILEIALGFVLWWLNQRLPSLPAMIWPGWLGMLMLNSVNVMAGPSPLIAPVVPPLPAAPLPALPPTVDKLATEQVEANRHLDRLAGTVDKLATE